MLPDAPIVDRRIGRLEQGSAMEIRFLKEFPTDESPQDFYEREGYLLLRQAFPVEVASSIRAQIITALRAQGISAAGTEPDVLGQGALPVSVEELYQNVDVSEVWANQELKERISSLFGEPVRIWRAIILRAVLSGVDANRAVPHQDGFAQDPTSGFRTFWTPLSAVRDDMGAIAIIPRSHRNGRIPTTLSESTQATAGNRPFHTVAIHNDDAEWERPKSMLPGDMLMFHPFMVHQGLPNRSAEGYARLSMDFRAQPTRTAPTPTSLYEVPDFKKYLKLDENDQWVLKDDQSVAR
jgi:Phytanoyl-CoA dioxygenase (PhyH)